ncbi:Flp family type IVb pilin [Acetobacter sp.]|uniref:Flp family type IVb pilin n=1 Tax=Acetobacter sp. TaxID=440 RepID=UPI0039EAEB2A
MIYYKKKIQQDVGATAVEYGILSALIAVVTILGLQATGTNLGTTYCTIANQLSQAVGAGATASGCSASSSSSSSSSSSADSSGSSADSSSSSSSSDSSSDSSSSSSTPAVYNSSNSYTAGSMGLNNMITFAMTDFQSMTGMYDADGNEITTPQQYAEALGVSAEDYQALVDAYNGTNHNATAQTNAQNQIKSDMANNTSANIYVPDLSQVSLTLSNGKTVENPIADVNWPVSYRLQNDDNTFSSVLYLNPPTGD